METQTTSSGTTRTPRKPTQEWSLQEHHKEHPYGISLTVPDEALTIKQIVEQHTRAGVPVPLDQSSWLTDQEAETLDPSFDSPDFTEVSRMDIIDQQQVVSGLKRDIGLFEKEVDEDNKRKAAKKAQEDAELEEVKEYMRQQKKSQRAKEGPQTPRQNDPSHEA